MRDEVDNLGYHMKQNNVIHTDHLPFLGE